MSSRHVALALVVCVPGLVVSARAEDRAAGHQAKLERLPASPAVLKAPSGLSGITVAKTAPGIDFAIFPNQWEGARLWSSWGDATFASDGKFYGSIGDHAAPHGTAYVYEIDPKSGTVKLVVDYNKVVNRPEEEYTPGKIHGGLADGGDGWLYFFGYRGSEGQTTKEVNYRGDWLLRYNLKSGDSENLGIAVPYSSVPVLMSHQPSKTLYGLAMPGRAAPEPINQFFRYDLESQKVVFSAPLKAQGPRAMIVAASGRAYYGDENGKFLRYDPREDKLTVLDAEIPGGMLRAASDPDKNGIVYCVSRDGTRFTFDTQKETVNVVGPAFVAGKLYIATCRLDPTGRYVYYIPGAHGKSSETGTPVLQWDVKTNAVKVIAFLNEAVREAKNYNLGGTYGIALNEDGSQLFINFNGSPLPGGKNIDFGQCSALVIHIPESERSGTEK